MSTTTEKDETRVSIDAGGGPVDMGTLSEFERNADEAARRLRQRTQLSFDLGMTRKVPDHASVKFSGELGIDHNLYRGDVVTVTVTDGNGEVIASGEGEIGWPAFKDQTIDEIVYTKRIHTASL